MARLDATVSAAQVEAVAQRGLVQFGGDFGTAVDAQVRPSLDRRHGGAPFGWRTGGREGQGRAAFDKLMSQIEAATGLSTPLHAIVVPQPQDKAITLPGGGIDPFQAVAEKPNRPAALQAICAGS